MRRSMAPHWQSLPDIAIMLFCLFVALRGVL